MLFDGLDYIVCQILSLLFCLLLLNSLLDVDYPLPDELLVLVLDLLRDIDGHLQRFALGLHLDDFVSDGHVDVLLLVAETLPQSQLSLLLFKFQSFHF